MATKFYRDASNNYIGAYDGATPPVGSIEVPSAPLDARCKWNGTSWNAPVYTAAEKLAPEVQKQLINLAQGICDFAIRNDKTILTVIDNKLTQIKNS